MSSIQEAHQRQRMFTLRCKPGIKALEAIFNVSNFMFYIRLGFNWTGIKATVIL